VLFSSYFYEKPPKLPEIPDDNFLKTSNEPCCNNLIEIALFMPFSWVIPVAYSFSRVLYCEFIAIFQVENLRN